MKEKEQKLNALDREFDTWNQKIKYVYACHPLKNGIFL